jgi:uncharacterized membrane protein YjjB (DUF3815 family)
MSLTLKQRAAVNVLKTFVGVLVATLGFCLVFMYVPIDILINVSAGSCLVFSIYMLYQVEVSKLEMAESLKKLNNVK